MAKRTIIRIDEEKCDGCGLCTRACPEGALRIVNGKARLVSESYCDGLGACIRECPRDAITFEEREAAGFDEEAVRKHLAATAATPPAAPACPGLRALSFALDSPPQAAAAPPPPTAAPSSGTASPAGTQLSQWPVQIQLVPITAPFWQNADLLIAADCVPVACGGFQDALVRGRKVIIFCPKLDDTAGYVDKLAAILRENTIRRITVAYMEVPCCGGTLRIVREAVARCGREIPIQPVKALIQGGALIWE